MLTTINAHAPASPSETYAPLKLLSQSMPAGQSGMIPINVKHVDGTTAYDLTGKALQLTIRDVDGNVVVSHQATITNALGGVAYFPFDVGDTDGKAGGYTYDVWLFDPTVTPQANYMLVDVSAFSITGVRTTQSTGITVALTQAPLAKGDKGDPGADGATASLATESANGLLAASDKKKIDGVVRNLVSDFGADPTNAVDSTAAFQAAFDSGADLRVPAGDYRIDGDIICQRAPVTMRGAGGGVNAASKLHFAPTARLIIRGSAAWSRFEDFAIFGTAAAQWSPGETINAGDARVNQYAYGGFTNLVQVALNGGVTGATEPAWPVRDDNLGYKTEGSLTDDNGITWRSISCPGVFQQAQAFFKNVYVQGVNGDGFYWYGYVVRPNAALTVQLNPGDTTATLADTTNFSPSAGILVCESEEMTYTGISGNTITGLVRGINGTTPATHIVGSNVALKQTVTSGSRMVGCQAQLNLGRGMYVEGTDSNGGNIHGLLAQDNWGGGIYDQSDVGNLYLGCLAETNGIYQWGANSPTSAFHVGAYEVVRPTPSKRTNFIYRATTPGTTGATEPVWPTVIGGTVADNDVVWTCVAVHTDGQGYKNRSGGLNSSVFVGCYTEPDQEYSEISSPGLWLGTLGSNFSPTSSGLIGSGKQTDGLGYTSGPLVTPALHSSLGDDGTNQPYAFTWKRTSDGDQWGIVLSADSKYWQLFHAGGAAGLWFANPEAGEGPGAAVMPYGIYFGNPFGHPRSMWLESAGLDQGAQPDASVGKVGDLWWNTYPLFGWPDGWRCTADAPAAVWEPFYLNRKHFFHDDASTTAAPFDLSSMEPFGNPIVNGVFTNLGTATMVGYLLPNGVARGSRKLAFFCDEDTGAGIRVQAQPGQKIRIGATVSTAGGYIESSDVGAFIELEEIGSGTAVWVATRVVGTWSAA